MILLLLLLLLYTYLLLSLCIYGFTQMADVNTYQNHDGGTERIFIWKIIRKMFLLNLRATKKLKGKLV